MNKRLSLRMPASCGELIQGKINGQEKLLSYPVNLYNYLTIEKRGEHNNKKSKICDLPLKMQSLFKLLAQEWNIQDGLVEKYCWHHQQNIPVGKGLASSTADLMLILTATALLTGKKLTLPRALEYLTAIEPTDSTIFTEFALLEQNKGSSWRIMGEIQPEVKVLALGQAGRYDTMEQRNFRGEIPDVSTSWQLCERGFREKNWYDLGKAATLSALAWQDKLHYPKLQSIINISEEFSCFGVNIAHSGNVIGILYEPEVVNLKKLRQELAAAAVFAHYPLTWNLSIVSGGVEVKSALSNGFKKYRYKTS